MSLIIADSKTFFRASRKAMSPRGMAEIWGVKSRQAYRLGADPASCSDTCEDPMAKLIKHLARLRDIDRRDILEEGLRLLADPVGYTVGVTSVATDRNSAYRELLDVNREIGELSHFIQLLIEENNVEEDYKRKILRQADAAIRQLLQLKDAIRKGLK